MRASEKNSFEHMSTRPLDGKLPEIKLKTLKDKERKIMVTRNEPCPLGEVQTAVNLDLELKTERFVDELKGRT